jgi:hypothetical protein
LPARRSPSWRYPLIETRNEWIVHGFSFANYLAELGDKE